MTPMPTKYEVSFTLRTAATVAKARKVIVTAANKPEAVIKASTTLEDEGHVHWDLLGVTPITN